MNQLKKVVPSIVNLLLNYSERLIEGVLIALIWANTDYPSLYRFLYGSPFGEQSLFHFHFLINDIFMVFFFGMATQEITQACLPGGALNPIKKAINPIFSTLGGIIGPVCVYFLFVHLTGNDSLMRGWAIPTATDIALAWLVARFAFGKAHPAISFLLLLAIADDGIGLAIIAIFYPDPGHPVLSVFLLLVLLGMAISYLFRKRQVASFWPYILIGGTFSWFGLYLAHLHPALALVPIIPFLPNVVDKKRLSDETTVVFKSTGSVVTVLNGGGIPTVGGPAFRDFFKKPVDIGLFGFGLANAGVPFSSTGSATWAVLLSLVIGKTVGITLFSTVASTLGFPLPTGMRKKDLMVAAMTGAIGMTVALFIAGVAFVDVPTQESAKMGALLSSGMVIPVLIAAKLLKIRKTKPAEE